jgi:hypothetical protein
VLRSVAQLELTLKNEGSTWECSRQIPAGGASCRRKLLAEAEKAMPKSA